MRITPLPVPRIGEGIDLMGTGAPYVTPHSTSDDWLYATYAVVRARADEAARRCDSVEH